MKRRHKHNAVRTVVDGITFPSKLEAARYQELMLLQRAGQISGLELQKPFELAPSVVLGGRKKPAVRFFADFVYQEAGKTVVEDAKGMVTPIYRLKLHLMKHVHGIEVREHRR